MELKILWPWSFREGSGRVRFVGSRVGRVHVRAGGWDVRLVEVKVGLLVGVEFKVVRHVGVRGVVDHGGVKDCRPE